MATREDVGRALAAVCCEIERQEDNKRAQSSSYTSLIRQLQAKRRQLSRMLSDGSWTQEDEWETGVTEAPMDKYAQPAEVIEVPALRAAE